MIRHTMPLCLALTSMFMAFPAAATPQKGQVFGEWGVECETPTNAPEKCFVSQTHTAKDNKGRLMKLAIGYLGKNDQPMIVATLPLGVSLPAGAAFRIDDSKTQTKLVYQSCSQGGCVAVAFLDIMTVKALQTAKKLTIAMMPMGGQRTMLIEAPMRGFSDAFATLLK